MFARSGNQSKFIPGVLRANQSSAKGPCCKEACGAEALCWTFVVPDTVLQPQLLTTGVLVGEVQFCGGASICISRRNKNGES